MQHKTFFLLASCCVFGLGGYAEAQKSGGNLAKAVIPNERTESYIDGNMRIEKDTGIARAIYNAGYAVKPGKPVAMAQQYLRDHAEVLGLKADLSDLEHYLTRETAGGYHVRFNQRAGRFPVYLGEVTVTINRDHVVTFVANGYKKISALAKVNDAASISASNALRRAKAHLAVNGKINLEKAELVVYQNKNETRLAYKATVVPAEEMIGDWEVLVDAKSGEVFRAQDKAFHYRDGGRTAKTAASGTGYVFDPDPISCGNGSYGSGGYIDNNDADSADLTAQRVSVTLQDITLSGGQYQLKGPYAEIVDSEAPLKGGFSQSSSTWNFTRNADAFEAVNAYYHIDKSMRYVNVTLGMTLKPYQYTTGVKADPHGMNGADDSHYLSSTGQLAFGEGGVDDAEDAEVIWHELGHGLHDWATGGQISQVDGLSEGCGDYWAASYTRSLNKWSSAASQYNWVFHWDGHNEYWAGRVVNYSALYPAGLVGQIHTDGQMWSSTLMSIWNSIGRTATDKDFLQCLSMLNSSSTQNDAANAFYQADAMINGGANQATILTHMQQRGYTVSLGPAAPSNLTATAASNSQINLAWTDKSTNESGFYVERKTGSGGTYAQIAALGANVQSYSNTGLTTGTTYYYRVRAYNGSGNSSYSNEANATTLSGTPPTAPSSLTATAAAWNQINLAWRDNSSNETGFYIERKTGASGTYAQIGSVGAGVKTYSNTGLTAGTIYYYRVRAYNGGGNSAYSNEANATTPGNSSNLALGKAATATSQLGTSNTPAQAVDGSTSTFWSSVKLSSTNKLQYFTVNLGASMTVSRVVVKWNSTNYAKTYAIQTSTTGSTFTTVYTDNAGNGGDDTCVFTSASVQYVRIEMSTYYKTYYQLKEFEIYASASKADEPIAGNSDLAMTLPEEISLQPNYPNPFNPSTTISFVLPARMRVTLKIFNLAGQEVATLVDGEQEGGRHQVVFDAAPLTSGVYFSVLQAGQQRQMRRLTLLK